MKKLIIRLKKLSNFGFGGDLEDRNDEKLLKENQSLITFLTSKCATYEQINETNSTIKYFIEEYKLFEKNIEKDDLEFETQQNEHDKFQSNIENLKNEHGNYWLRNIHLHTNSDNNNNDNNDKNDSNINKNNENDIVEAFVNDDNDDDNLNVSVDDVTNVVNTNTEKIVNDNDETILIPRKTLQVFGKPLNVENNDDKYVNNINNKKNIKNVDNNVDNTHKYVNINNKHDDVDNVNKKSDNDDDVYSFSIPSCVNNSK
jgi:hypothetical protein